MINFNTDKLIFVGFPWGAGGKFLINCLGLSDNAVLQDYEYAKQQLDGKFDKNDKINYIRKKLKEVKTDWVDLDLGCYQLTNVSNTDYLSIPSDEIKQNTNFHPVITELSQRNQEYFFMIAHTNEYFDAYFKIWANAKLIILKNCFIMQEFRKTNIIQDIDHPNCLFYWDCNWFFDETLTQTNIKKLYDLLDLNDYDETFISEYHKTWLTILNKLSTVDK